MPLTTNGHLFSRPLSPKKLAYRIEGFDQYPRKDFFKGVTAAKLVPSPCLSSPCPSAHALPSHAIPFTSHFTPYPSPYLCPLPPSCYLSPVLPPTHLPYRFPHYLSPRPFPPPAQLPYPIPLGLSHCPIPSPSASPPAPLLVPSPAPPFNMPRG